MNNIISLSRIYPRVIPADIEQRNLLVPEGSSIDMGKGMHCRFVVNAENGQVACHLISALATLIVYLVPKNGDLFMCNHSCGLVIQVRAIVQLGGVVLTIASASDEGANPHDVAIDLEHHVQAKHA